MPITAPIGTATSCDDPLNLAVNWIHWLSIVSLRVAVALTFSTISPFFTNAAGTRVCGLTRTARYGVRPLSAHHSQMARTRYVVADCADMGNDITLRTNAVKTAALPPVRSLHQSLRALHDLVRDCPLQPQNRRISLRSA